MIAAFFNKIYAYVIIAGVVIGAFFATYLKGRSDSSNATQRRVLGKDLENRRVGEAIRGSVDSLDDPTDRLQRWTRRN